MFEIKVTSLRGLFQEIDWQTHIISLLEEDYLTNVKFSNRLFLECHDIEKEIPGYKHPTYQNLLKALDFCKHLTDEDKLVVHCQAGISRSTSTAIGILIDHGFNYIDAYNKIEEQRPFLLPNTMIINYIDNHFGLNDDLNQLVKERSQAFLEKNNGLIVIPEGYIV